MVHVLFVCTGNTCRSPMAEAILKSMKIEGLEVKSAGVFTSDGLPASTNAQKVLDKEKIPHSHQSTQLTEETIRWADYILTMTRGHKQMIVDLYPDSKGKIYTLKEFAGETEDLDISDPFGGSLEIYEQTYKEIFRYIEKAIEKLPK